MVYEALGNPRSRPSRRHILLRESRHQQPRVSSRYDHPEEELFRLESPGPDHIRFLEIESEAWEHSKSYHNMGILDLLTRYSQVACGDERDRIYAFLGLANDVRSPFVNIAPVDRDDLPSFMRKPHRRRKAAKPKESIPIAVDYEADPKHVYAEFAEQLLRHKRHLELLHCAGAFRRPVTKMSRPVSKLGPGLAYSGPIPTVSLRAVVSRRWPAAGGKAVPQLPWCSVSGFIFDTVSVACKIPVSDISDAPERRVMPPVGQLCSELGMRGRYVTGERVWQALGLTFIADHAHNDILKRNTQVIRTTIMADSLSVMLVSVIPIPCLTGGPTKTARA